MKASEIRKGMKIAAGRGHREMDGVADKGSYLWCEYREFDANGQLKGHFASRYEKTKTVRRVY